MVAIVRATFSIIIMVVTVVVASVFTTIIIATLWVISPGDPGDFFSMALVGLFNIGILVGRLGHLVDRCQWLPIELPATLIVMIQPMEKGGDDLDLKDVWNLDPHFQETLDVALEQLAYPLVDPGQVMLCSWSFIGCLVVFNEHFLEIIPRVYCIYPEACETIHHGGFERNWHIICHHVVLPLPTCIVIA